MITAQSLYVDLVKPSCSRLCRNRKTWYNQRKAIICKVMELIPVQEIHTCEVTEKRELTENVFSLKIICPAVAEAARAGQFVMVRCGAERVLRRPISICRISGETIELVFERKGGGTRWLAECARGHMLDILGPLGNGFDLPSGRVIMIGGGIGAPPLLFAAESLRGRADCILGFRSAANVILAEDFRQVCGKVILTTDDGSLGLHGTVAGPLEELLKEGGYEAVAACGPRPMLSAVASLSRLYAVKCFVSLEERMGCGVGACVVCACETTASGGERTMSRVCRDGPVFDAHDVVWE